MSALSVAMSGTKPTIISLFCGTGGSSLGYKWAGFEEYRRGYKDNALEIKKYFFSKPIKTITKTRGGWGTVYPTDFTESELKVLCSFPVDWKMSGSYDQKWARLGNAVMPKQMQAIAETIKNEMLGKTAVKG